MLTSILQYKRVNNERGFTLIELLIVILIIGILASIAVPMFLNQRSAAVDASLKSDTRNLVTAMHTWKAQNPTSSDFPSAAWRLVNVPGSNSHNNYNIPFEPTEGNYMRVYAAGGSGSFCIEAWSPGSKEYPSEARPYTFFPERGVPGRTSDC